MPLELIEVGKTVPLEDINDSAQKVRVETADKGIDDLLASIRNHGQIHAISLLRENGSMVVINGHRRFTAARLGKLAALRANVYKVPDGQEADRDVLVQQHLYAANQSESLLPIEKARMFDQLMTEFDWDVAKVAELFEGETAETVTDTLRFLSIDEQVLDLVAAHPGKFSESHLRVLAEYASPSVKHSWRMKPEEQLRVAREIVDQIDKQVVRDPRKLEARIKSVINERRKVEKERKATIRKVQTDPVKALVKAVESVESAARALKDVDLPAITDIDPADKGDVLKRLYDSVEAITVFTDDRVSKLKVRRVAS